MLSGLFVEPDAHTSNAEQGMGENLEGMMVADVGDERQEGTLTYSEEDSWEDPVPELKQSTSVPDLPAEFDDGRAQGAAKARSISHERHDLFT